MSEYREYHSDHKQDDPSTSPAPPPTEKRHPRFVPPRFNSKYTSTDNSSDPFSRLDHNSNTSRPDTHLAKKTKSLNDIPKEPTSITPTTSRQASRVYTFDNSSSHRHSSIRPLSPSSNYPIGNSTPNTPSPAISSYLGMSPFPQYHGGLVDLTNNSHSNIRPRKHSLIPAPIVVNETINNLKKTKSNSSNNSVSSTDFNINNTLAAVKHKSSHLGLSSLRSVSSSSSTSSSSPISPSKIANKAKSKLGPRRTASSIFKRFHTASRRESESLDPSKLPQQQQQQQQQKRYQRGSDPTNQTSGLRLQSNGNLENIPFPLQRSSEPTNRLTPDSITNLNAKLNTNLSDITSITKDASFGELPDQDLRASLNSGSSHSEISNYDQSSAANWRAPESWKVKVGSTPDILDKPVEFYNNENEEGGTSTEESSLLTIRSPTPQQVSSHPNLQQLQKQTTCTSDLSIPPSIPVSRNTTPQAHSKIPSELRGASKSSLRVFKDDKSTVLPCTLDTTINDILDTLCRKRFLKQDAQDHIIVLKYGGLTRTLSSDEKPLKIQRKLLFYYGYTEKDNLDYIERTDMSFLYKFLVQDKGVELIPSEKRKLIDSEYVDLKNWNLQDIPNFLYAEPIITLDVSQNPSFEFTSEFMRDCRNLVTLKFTNSGNRKFPIPVVLAPRLIDLDLEVNYFKQIPSEISSLKSLNSLNLACNKISSLPDSFSELTSLTHLNLSSNRIVSIPNSILKIKGLKVLDLSYNGIEKINENLIELKNLEVLRIAANKLNGKLPSFFQFFENLIKIDLRFNKLRSIDSLKDLQTLEVIRAAGNLISVFTSSSKMLYELELNINPLTDVNFNSIMENLKTIDFSKGNLTTCQFFNKLPALDTLILDNNHLGSLSEDLNLMKNLTHLSAFKNNLLSLPDSIGHLKKLKYLDVHLNNISMLTKEVWRLSSLETLNVSSNLLELFPDPPLSIISSPPPVLNSEKHLVNALNHTGIPIDSENIKIDEELSLSPPIVSVQSASPTRQPHMLSPPVSPSTIKRRSIIEETIKEKGKIGLERSLRVLSMNDNKLTDSVIHTVSVFKNLETLNLSYNDLYDIPPGYLLNLKKLKQLFLSGNHLSSLPVDDLESFTELYTLHLNGNRFQTLPADLAKIVNLSSLDVGSNSLKYNIGNIPYDWNWSYNKRLKYLNFSGNKRLEIKSQHKKEDSEDEEPLDSFLVLKNLRILGLMDVTLITDLVPDQSVDTRIRSTSSQLGSKFGYGISDTLGDRNHITIRDFVIEKFRGNSDELLITIYDGRNCSPDHSDKISRIMQETFQIHLTKQLETLNGPNGGKSGKTVEDCLRNAYLTMNSEMNILINRDVSSTFSSAAAYRTTTTDELTLDEDGLTGCCATIVYIKGEDIYIANIGDIMGIMTKSDGNFDYVTTKHEPYAPEEYDRIRQTGGFVNTEGYLDNVAIVSRAVGYFKLVPHITASPSIYKFKLTGNEETIALATSEVWSKVPFDLAADIVRQEKANPGVAAEKLRDFAISYGSTDKSTAVVLSLGQFLSNKTKYHDNRSSHHPEDLTVRKLDYEIEPPIGEVAMVFTDIKNSTLLWDTYPYAMRSAIKVHNGIMRRQLRIIGGYEVKTEGDAFMVSFPTITSALLWCFQVQSQLLTTNEWPDEILTSDQGCEIKDDHGNIVFRGLSVRMGIHWGRPVCERDIVTKRMDYFGPMVNRASRVSAVADGGQITVSTDFYTEFERIKDFYESQAPQTQQITMSSNDPVQDHLNKLKQIGWVEESIGSRKLKGLETPEKIWLIFPSPLASRLKALTSSENGLQTNSSVTGGITTESVWKLRLLSLRLEKICSYLSNEELKVVHNQAPTSTSLKTSKFLDDVNKTLDSQLGREADLMLFMDHLVVRIENCISTLVVRKSISELNSSLHGNSGGGLVRSDMASLYVDVLKAFEDMKNDN